MAMIFESGRYDTPAHFVQAFLLLQKVASAGHVNAMAVLAVCLELRWVVEQNDEMAL